MLHAVTGLVFYVIGYLLVARPVQKMVLPNLHWSLTAVAYGVALWVFALYVMAHLVAGNAFLPPPPPLPSGSVLCIKTGLFAFWVCAFDM